MVGKPWMIVPISTAIEKCEELKKLSEHFDLVVVKDEDVDKVAALVQRMRRKPKIEIIERFEIEGRGTVFTCYLPELKDYKELDNLYGQTFEHEGETFRIRDIEMSRGGMVDVPNRKKWYGLQVTKVINAPVAQLDGAAVS